jgi:predicted Zn-dependent protease
MVRLEHGTDPLQAVIVETRGFATALRNAFPGLNKTLRTQSQTTRFALWSVGALLLAVAAYVAGAPVAATWAAAKVPIEWEAELGKGVVSEMAPESKRCTDPAAYADVRAVLDRLIAAAPASGSTFHLFVVRDTIVNAFAAPGGYVVVNEGLLRAARTPEELAGVLAHEVQHVLQRHTTRGILRDAPARIAIAVLFGGTGAETVASAVGTLGVLSYRRGDESEADREGLRLMTAAHIDPVGMVSFMEVLAQRSSGPRVVSYLTSHPHSADRVSALRAQAAESRGDWRPLMSDASWKRVQGICDR